LVAKAFSVPSIETISKAAALYALSAPEVPQSARDEAIERAANGELVSKAEAEEMIARAIEAEPEKFEELVAELRAAAAETSDEPRPIVV
jgi:hypothetical protein